MNYISSYCHISLNHCFINGKEKHSFNSNSIDDFLKKLYQSLNISYPKFHKMDKLAKIAFLGVELLKIEIPEILDYRDDAIALLFSNNNSSAITDIKFQESYQKNRVPSPALFVYTLPNILMGEIAIRNKWYGENTFTVSKIFDSKYFTAYSDLLLHKNSEAVLCGWLNLTGDDIEAFLFFITKKDFKSLNLLLDSNQLLEKLKNQKKSS